MRSSNPVLTRLGDVVRQERSAAPVEYDYKPYNPYQQAPVARMMTIDDVVVRTVALLLVTGVAGAAGWFLVPNRGPIAALALFGSMIAGLVLGLVISFARITNPVVISIYAVAEGILLGVVSRWFESAYNGIVFQAVVATFGIFAGMAVLYKMRVLRATPKFTRFVIGALIGIVVLSFANWIAAMVGFDMGLVNYSTSGKVGWLPIVFCLAAICVGALTFILDFDQVEQGIRAGLPEKYAWYCSFGILVGLIFLYWQILRMLGYLRR